MIFVCPKIISDRAAPEIILRRFAYILRIFFMYRSPSGLQISPLELRTFLASRETERLRKAQAPQPAQETRREE